MRKVFFALIFNVFIVYSASATNVDQYKEECLSFIKRPKVELFASYGKLRYQFDKDENYIKRKTSKKLAERHEQITDGFLPIGLTDVNDVFNMDIVVGSTGVSHGYVCVYPESLKAIMEYSLPTIYISENVKKGTCMYDVALRHENTHMQIYIEALDYFLPILKKHLEDAFDEVGVKIVASSESVEKTAMALNEAYIASIQKKIDAWWQEVEMEQFKLDTAEHYILENKICQEIDYKR